MFVTFARYTETAGLIFTKFGMQLYCATHNSQRITPQGVTNNPVNIPDYPQVNTVAEPQENLLIGEIILYASCVLVRSQYKMSKALYAKQWCTSQLLCRRKVLVLVLQYNCNDTIKLQINQLSRIWVKYIHLSSLIMIFI